MLKLWREYQTELAKHGVTGRAMLSRLARFAAAKYAELEALKLRHRIAMLERKLKAR